MSQINVDTITNRLGTAGPTVPSLTVTNNVTVGGALTVTGSINTSGIITASSFSGNGVVITGIATVSSVVVSAGTTALPSISPTGDTNTGIFFPAADTVAISEGGAEALRVDSSGRLLVGTTSNTGANLLQVNSDALVNGITVGRGASAVSSNTAVGNGALGVNTTGTRNTAVGDDALLANTTGLSNTAIGTYALQANITGNYNTAIGDGTLYNNTDSNNVAVGYLAMYTNTSGDRNTAIGKDALRENTTGYYNVAVGTQALTSNTTGLSNTSVGERSLVLSTTGSNNTALGREAGHGSGAQSNTTGSNNTFIGAESMGASATASNVITLGDGSIATLRCQVTTITALSDVRDKTNITNIPAGLDFINALRPVAFDWNTRDGKKVGIHEFGFIAQELQEAQATTGITVPNLVSTENPDKLEASAGTLLPVLVNAVQELTAMVRDLQAELSILKGA